MEVTIKEGDIPTKQLTDFSISEPVKIITEETVSVIFGNEFYEYDFPKWCKANRLKCFYIPEYRCYLIFPDFYKAV